MTTTDPVTLWVVQWTPVRPWSELEPLLPDHLRYIVDLEHRGSVFASGPFVADDGSVDGTGMTLLRAGSADEAAALADRDPFVLAGLRRFDVKPWRVVEGGFTLAVRFSDFTFHLA